MASRLEVRARCLQCNKIFNLVIEVWTSVREGDILTNVTCLVCKVVTPFEVIER